MITEARKIVEKWNSLTSIIDRETYIRNYLISLFLNADTRAFLQEFTIQFEGVERLKILKLCRKILEQYPDRKSFIDKGHYQAFQEEYQKDFDNDISVDGIKWIDEELSYLQYVKELDEVSDKGEAIQTTTPPPNVPELKERMSKKDVLEEYHISSSTFDRWRRDGLPHSKRGKKIYVERKLAEEWVKANSPNRITVNIGQRRLKAG